MGAAWFVAPFSTDPCCASTCHDAPQRARPWLPCPPSWLEGQSGKPNVDIEPMRPSSALTWPPRRIRTQPAPSTGPRSPSQVAHARPLPCPHIPSCRSAGHYDARQDPGRHDQRSHRTARLLHGAAPPDRNPQPCQPLRRLLDDRLVFMYIITFLLKADSQLLPVPEQSCVASPPDFSKELCRTPLHPLRDVRYVSLFIDRS